MRGHTENKLIMGFSISSQNVRICEGRYSVTKRKHLGEPAANELSGLSMGGQNVRIPVGKKRFQERSICTSRQEMSLELDSVWVASM